MLLLYSSHHLNLVYYIFPWVSSLRLSAHRQIKWISNSGSFSERTFYWAWPFKEYNCHPCNMTSTATKRPAVLAWPLREIRGTFLHESTLHSVWNWVIESMASTVWHAPERSVSEGSVITDCTRRSSTRRLGGILVTNTSTLPIARPRGLTHHNPDELSLDFSTSGRNSAFTGRPWRLGHLQRAWPSLFGLQ